MRPPKRMTIPRRAGARQQTMFPHTVTIYNTAVEYDEDYKEILTNHITVLRGVLLDASKAANVRESGLTGADAVNLYIPFDVKAEDGITGKPRKYIPPVEFWPLEDHSEYWTMAVGAGNKADVDTATFFIKDIVVEPDRDRAFLEKTHDDVYSITKIDVKDFGGLQHFEVGGN